MPYDTAMRRDLDFERTPILVWQMGKVGSMAIHSALVEAGLPAVHIHRLNPRWLEQRKRMRAEAGFPPALQHIEADRLAPLLADRSVGFRVVSAVRDPVAQALSVVFQNWHVFPPGDGVDRSDPAQIARWFIDAYDHRESLTWFEDEIEEVFGTSVYDAPFDRRSKSLHLDHGRIRLLVLRSEDDNTAKEQALQRFLDRGDIRLGYANDAASKPEGALYAEVKRTLKLPPTLVEQYLSSRWVRHFYDADEIVRFRSAWS